jgi:hypothetical protein
MPFWTSLKRPTIGNEFLDVLFDALPYVKEGTLQEKLDELFG